MSDFSRCKSNRSSGSLVYSDEINDKLLKLMSDTGYLIEQVNGQRIFSSPRQNIIPPSRGCEVFVGKIPRDCYEDELFPVLALAGRVHELRLMMLFSGTNRGYAFVMYERPEEAKRAVEMLDGYEIRRGHRIGVLPCLNNCRLFIGCFGPGDRSHDELEQILRNETEGVAAVWRRGVTTTRGRWYLLVEYVSHRSAAVARRHLTPRRDSLFGPRVIVDWEVPMERRGQGSRSPPTPGRRIQSSPSTPLPIASSPIMQTPTMMSSNKLRRAQADINGQLVSALDDLSIGRSPGSYSGRMSYASPRSPRSPGDTFSWHQSLDMNGGNNAMASSHNWLSSVRSSPLQSSSPDMLAMLNRRESAQHSIAQQRRHWPPPTQQAFRDASPYPSGYPTLQQLLLSSDSGVYSDPEANQHPSSPGSSGSGSSTLESPWSSAGDYRPRSSNFSPPLSSASRARLLWDSTSSEYLNRSLSDVEGLCSQSSLLSPDCSPTERLGGKRYLFGNGEMQGLDSSYVGSHLRRVSPMRSCIY